VKRLSVTLRSYDAAQSVESPAHLLPPPELPRARRESLAPSTSVLGPMLSLREASRPARGRRGEVIAFGNFAPTVVVRQAKTPPQLRRRTFC
jgi:hypothetical protein